MDCADCGKRYQFDSGRFSKTQWLKGNGIARCKTCVAASGDVGGYKNDGYGGFHAVRDNQSTRYKSQQDETGTSASVNLSRMHGQGAFKDVYKGVYTAGTRRGEDCVVKKFRASARFNEDWFNLDIKAAWKAGEIIAKFNSHLRLSRELSCLCKHSFAILHPTPHTSRQQSRAERVFSVLSHTRTHARRSMQTGVKVRINVPETTTFRGKNGLYLLEPYVHNWRKFNSNTGWCRDDTVTGEVMQALSHFSYHTSGGQFVLCDLQVSKLAGVK